jgi:plastocyanin
MPSIGRGLATFLATAIALSVAAASRGGTAAEPARDPVPQAPSAPAPPPPKPPPTYVVAGSVELLERGRRSVDRTLLPRHTVVVFEPAKRTSPAKPVTVEMKTLKKEFEPRLLVVPVGSTVRFPNLDPILHNVFSVSGKNSFDLGLLGKGPGKSATFREAGIVRVFCNVHHAMFAYVYVTASPHWATVGDDGRFRLAGLPAGAGKLTVWNERSAPTVSDLVVPAAGPLALGVEITVPRIPPHKNKLGKSYGGTNYG